MRLGVTMCRAWAGLLLATLLLTSGCATNPVTGGSDFVLMSEQQEIAIGRENHAKILKQYRPYDNPGLQAYVQRIGERLAANSHRNNLIYRFTVLDSNEVNAFALPGGYIYITRGLMAYLNSEAELAAVLGHEIGHVTARHSVRQQSAATATGILGAVLAAGVGIQGTQDLFNMVGGALVRGYGREHELESDRLGAEYLAKSGYDPRAMIEVVGVLKNQEIFEVQQAKAEGREPRVYHGVFSTHPDNDRRLHEVVGAADRFKSPGAQRVNRDEYLQQLDGLVFGDSEHEGVRRDNRFYHAELGFAVHFPQRWRIENMSDRVIALAPGGAGVLQMQMEDLNQRLSPRDYLRVRLKINDLRSDEAIRMGEIQGHTGITPGNSPFGKRLLRITVLYFDNRAFLFLGAAKDTRQPYAFDRDFLEAARSFHRLTGEERALARSQRLQLIRADGGTRMAELARRSPITNHPEAQLRLLNDLYPHGEPAAGQPLKIVR